MHIDRRLLGWGVFFILVGAIPLAVRGGFLDAERVVSWPSLWPVLLIGWGLGLLLRQTPIEWIGGGVTAVVLGLMAGGRSAGPWWAIGGATLGSIGASGRPPGSGRAPSAGRMSSALPSARSSAASLTRSPGGGHAGIADVPSAVWLPRSRLPSHQREPSTRLCTIAVSGDSSRCSRARRRAGRSVTPGPPHRRQSALS